MTQEYVRLSQSAFGLLYGPDTPAAESRVGLIVMHPNSNYLNHVAGREMARRGFRVLCVNGRYCNTRRENLIWEQVPLDLQPAVEFMRALPGLRTVILVGHSGGGQLMPFYQNIAENGVGAGQGHGRFAHAPARQRRAGST
jgi:predicted alpha/beta-fold hydrolase